MNAHGTKTRRMLGAKKDGILGYVPYEADKASGALSRAFPGLVRNQHLKRGGYLMMGRVAGPDPLLGCSRQHSSHDTGVDGTANDAPRCWLADQAGQRRTHRRPGGLWGGISHEVRPVTLLRCSPNIFTSPSEASKKETVSTPSLVTGTSANDCMREGIRERNCE